MFTVHTIIRWKPGVSISPGLKSVRVVSDRETYGRTDRQNCHS